MVLSFVKDAVRRGAVRCIVLNSSSSSFSFLNLLLVAVAAQAHLAYCISIDFLLGFAHIYGMVWCGVVISCCTLHYAACCLVRLQEMLAGPMTALNQGVVRNVSRVEYHGKTLVVKTLLQQDQPSHYLKHLEMHQLEVLILDTVRVLLETPVVCGLQ